jgi:hypothetical protein
MVASYPLCTIAPSTTALSTATDRAFSITVSESTAKPLSVTLYYIPDISNSDLTPATADPMKVITFPILATSWVLTSGTYAAFSVEVLLTNLQSVNYTVFGYVFAGTTQNTLVNAAGQIAVTNSGGVTGSSATVNVSGTPIATANLNWAFIDSNGTGFNNELYIITAVGSTSSFTIDRNAVRTISNANTGIIASTVLNSPPPMTAPVIQSVALHSTTATSANVTLADDKFVDAPRKVQFIILSNAQTGAHSPTPLIQSYTYMPSTHNTTPLQYTLTGLTNDVVYSISARFINDTGTPTVTSPLSAVTYYATSSTLAVVTSTSFKADLTDGSLKLSFSRPTDAQYNILPVGKYVLELLDSAGLALSPSQTFIITPGASDTDATVYSKSFTTSNITLGTAYKVSVRAYDTANTVGAVFTQGTTVTSAKYLFPIVLVNVASLAPHNLSAFFTVTPSVTGMGPITTTNSKDDYWVQPIVDGINGTPFKQSVVSQSESIKQLLLSSTATNGKLYSYNIWPAMAGDTNSLHSPSVLVTGTPYDPTTPITPVVDLSVTVPSNPVTSTAVTVAWGLSTTTVGLTPSGYEISASYTYQPGSTSNPSGSPVFIAIPIYNAPAGSTTYTFNIATTEPIFVKIAMVAYANVNNAVLRAPTLTNYANQSMWGNPTAVISTGGGTAKSGLLVTWPQAATQKVGTFTKYTLTLQQQLTAGASAWVNYGVAVDITPITTTSSLAFTQTAYGELSTNFATSEFRVMMTYTVSVIDSTGTTQTIVAPAHYSASLKYSIAKPRILSVTFDSTKKIASIVVAKDGVVITGIAMVAMCNNGTSIVPLTNVPVFTDTLTASDTLSMSLTFAYPILDATLFAINASGIAYGSFTA